MEQFFWDMPSDTWCTANGLLNLATCMDNPIYLSRNIKEYSGEIWNGFDHFLSTTGYRRVGNYYSIISFGNKSFFGVTFCYNLRFARSFVEYSAHWPLTFFCKLVRHLQLCQVKKLERGNVIFRCAGYNEMRLLKGHNELKSFYGLKQEIFTSKNDWYVLENFKSIAYECL